MQAAIDASSSGDTVVVPAGSATWTTPVRFANKSLDIIGAGIGQTVITRNTPVDNSCLSAVLRTNDFCYLSDFTFNTISSAQSGIIAIDGVAGKPTCQFRITKCRIEITPSSPTTSFRGIAVYSAYGLIDHCYFRATTDNGQGISVLPDNNFRTTNAWHTPQFYGDTNAVVIEDCTFDFSALGDGCYDAYDGSKVVFRYNNATNTNIGWHGADTGLRSARMFEVYGNHFTVTRNEIYTAIRCRGGSGVIWGNTASGFTSFCLLSYYAADPSFSRFTWGTMTGSNPADGNYDGSGYPGLDQPGRGSFPVGTAWRSASLISYATRTDYQALEGIYAWGNSFEGNTNVTLSLDDTTGSANIRNVIKKGRDYFDNMTKPGYVPLAYPHPLVGRGQQPRPPVNLRIVP